MKKYLLNFEKTNGKDTNPFADGEPRQALKALPYAEHRKSQNYWEISLAIADLIEQINEKAKISEYELETRLSFAARINDIISEPNNYVKKYISDCMLIGSSINGFCLSNSDTDILVLLNDQDLISRKDDVVEILKISIQNNSAFKNQILNLEYIFNANVPLIKFEWPSWYFI